MAERLSRDLAASREIGDESSPVLRPRAPTFGAAKGDIRDVYRKVAPSTVMVRSGQGFGTGIVIAANGYILTNHHVVARAETVDFKQRVLIERGTLNAQGVMEPEGTSHVAWVVKSDPLIDLAIVKLESPPADLKPIKIATKLPVPGEPVSALGHGAIGLLWAIKDGEISSIGKLSSSLAQIVGAECRVSEDPTAADACKAGAASAELERQLLAKEVPGLVIQTSCTISPGDSGGPLVNRAGELVGVNAFLRSDPRVAVTTNFHIHVSEVREFMREVPTEPLARAPSPWEQLGWGGSWADGDGDGKNDLMTVGAMGRAAVFADLAQTSPANAGQLRSKIDADFILARVGGQVMAWYDVDGDGALDRIVVDGGKEPSKAWALKKERELGTFLGAAKLVDPTVFSGARRDRMTALLPLIALASGVGAEDVPISALPVLPAALVAPRQYDLDRNGSFDSVSDTSALGTLVLVDPSEKVLGQARRGTALASLKAPITIFYRGTRAWYFTGDVVFALDDSSSGVISDAWMLTAKRELGDAQPQFVGREVVYAVAARFAGEEQKRLLTVLSATPRKAVTAAGYPHPIFDVGVDVQAENSAIAGLEWSAVSVLGTRGASALAFELDAEALQDLTPEKREADAKQGGAGTDFAWVRRGTWEWYLYDTDHDAKFDAAIIVHGDRVIGRRVVNGVASDAPELTRGPRVQPALFPDASRRDALKALAPVFFKPQVIGD